MIRQQELFGQFVPPTDVVYTPEHISLGIINHLKPSGSILDPCRGDGSFWKKFPLGSDCDYCEISEGKDFFDYQRKMDWIIGNPPYSIFEQFLEHSFELANNVSFLVPTNKIFQRQIIMERINKWGRLRSIIVYGSGQLIGFPFGFSVGNFYMQKGFNGNCEMILGLEKANIL